MKNLTMIGLSGACIAEIKGKSTGSKERDKEQLGCFRLNLNTEGPA